VTDGLVLGLTPGFFVFTFVVALIGFIMSSTFGVGGAVLLIPVLAQRMPAAHAVALSAPVMLFNNVLKAWVFRRHLDKRATWLVSALALPCAGVGALWSARLDDRYILLGVAALIVLSLVVEHGLGARVRVSSRALLAWGALTGAVSGLCGAAGPPTAIGLRGYGLSREAFIATVAVFAVLLQLVKIPAYVAAGAFPIARWPLAAVLSLLSLVGVWVAPALLRRISTRVFSGALDALLLVSAIWIVWDVAHR
jgi:uncharacterized membrane protein YfcA